MAGGNAAKDAARGGGAGTDRLGRGPRVRQVLLVARGARARGGAGPAGGRQLRQRLQRRDTRLGRAAGRALAAVTSWWLLAVGAACIAAAWFYTGGPKPYGYSGLGEVFVFLCFGVVAVAGTAYVQMKALSWLGLAASVPAGLLACALLMVNNLRDIGTDTVAGKRTLAVMLGDARSRAGYVLMLLVPFGVAALLAFFRPLTLLTALALPLARLPVRSVRAGASGPALIRALGQTGRLQLAFGIAVTIGLAIRL